MTDPHADPSQERLVSPTDSQHFERGAASTPFTPFEIRVRQWWSKRWMVVSFVAVFAVIGYLLAGSFTETQRNQRQIDKVRLPLCSVMYTALSHAPATQAQANVRADYLRAYGPDGLKCPKPLLPVTS